MFYIDISLLKEINQKEKVKINGLFSFIRTNIANSIIRGLWLQGILSSINIFMSQDTLIGDCKSILNMSNFFSGPLFKDSVTILEFENECNFHMEFFTFLLEIWSWLTVELCSPRGTKAWIFVKKKKKNLTEYFIVWLN